MKIGLIQYSPEWENPEDNLINIHELIKNSASDEEILIFPEMTLTGFTMSAKKFSEEIDGIATVSFIRLSQKLKKHIFAGIIEKDNNKIYNSLYHFDKNGLITARYRKIHPYSPAKENKYFDASKEPVVTYIGKIRIGLSICYDLRFPELYRFYAKEKADILINIANWPVQRIHHWKLLLRARAIENQCFMIGVNRVGNDPFHKYNGYSSIYDPMGNEIISVSDEEKFISAEIDIESVKATRDKFPFLDDIKLI